jgi:hypothetical protein
MNKNKNPNLPANAIATTDVEVGMMILLGAYTCRVTSVKWYGDRGVIIADGIRRTVNRAGTMRLAM